MLVLTVDIAGLLITRLSALVERKLSGKHVLFMLGGGGGVVMESKMSDAGSDKTTPDLGQN